jgi:hypothetical protein
MLHVYAEAVAGQVEPDQVGDGPLVLDHEHEPLCGARLGHIVTKIVTTSRKLLPKQPAEATTSGKL